jgi:23S rRNA (cytidine1920-2'-O)/16S rRNA (cytidine1409-2'-O)-methyltransferase
MSKVRLDLLLTERGLVESRTLAQRMVMAGQVRVDGQVELKPSSQVDATSKLEIKEGQRFVSRGGDKLEAVFSKYSLNINGFICADVGSSTGGFTDCLLQHGALKVYAIDVGKGILHWKMRNDPRVVVMEETNARHLDKLPEPVDFVTIDVSFISLKIIMPVVQKWLSDSQEVFKIGSTNESRGVIALIKPQFEAGRQLTAKNKGVIRDIEIHEKVLTDILSFTQNLGFTIKEVIPSPILGPKGNREFLAWLGCEHGINEDIKIKIDQALGINLK